MKKTSLMGVSVVAASLLAAAPVVAPIANLATPATQVVKADDTNKTKATNLANALSKSLVGNTEADSIGGDVDLAAPQSRPAAIGSGFINDGKISSNGAAVSNFSTKAFQNGFIGTDISSIWSGSSNFLSYTLSYTVNYADGNGDQPLYNVNSVKAAVTKLKERGGNLTAHYKFIANWDEEEVLASANPTATFKASSQKSAYVTTSDVTVPYGAFDADVVSPGFVRDNGVKILNANGDNITSSLGDSILTSDLFYDSVSGHTSGEQVAVSSSAVVVLSEGTYNQQVKIQLYGGEDGIFADVNDAKAASNAGRLSLNGHSYSDVSDKNVAGMKIDDNGVLEITRKVTVGKPGVTDAPYKGEKVDGVVTVTTKEGTAAQVYDQAGNPVYSRALVPGSRWVTGQKRTLLKNGKVYYQVSTNEFLSADDVSFQSNSSNGESTSDHYKGAVTVAQIGNKVFTITDGNYGYVWAKDDDNNGMHVVKNRLLAPNSKWQSGAKATMTTQDGKKHEFYQVSTNEWIDAGVGTIN